MTPHHVQGFVDVSGGHRADRAEVLGQHQIRLKVSHCLRVQAIDRLAVAETRTHQLVHLSRIGRRGESGERHCWLLPCRGRPVTLVSHPYQAVLEAECVDDLGGRGQQGENTHPTIVPHWRRSRYEVGCGPLIAVPCGPNAFRTPHGGRHARRGSRSSHNRRSSILREIVSLQAKPRGFGRASLGRRIRL